MPSPLGMGVGVGGTGAGSGGGGTAEQPGLLFPTQYHLEQKRKKELEYQMLSMSMGMSADFCAPSIPPLGCVYLEPFWF